MRRALSLILLLGATGAQAQGWQCQIPPRISAPAVPLPDAPPRIVPVTRYTLALSWSPEFCRTRKGDPASAMQCGGQTGRFGFILHGLWPEGQGRAYPQWCPMREAPTAETLRRHLCTTPSPELLAHEWAKHGTCMTMRPADYFARGDALFRTLRFPDMARLSRGEGLDAGQVRKAFTAANPALRPDMIRLLLGRDGWLREVHLCYSRRFRPDRCPAGRGGPADGVPVKVWRSF